MSVQLLTHEQVWNITDRLSEPYSTLVLFLAVTGLRIGEAIAVKFEDFEGSVLHVSRQIYKGRVCPLTAKAKRDLPIDPTLIERMQKLGGGEWVFRSDVGTPIDPGNARTRYLQKTARELGIHVSGWHDFRHTLTTGLRRQGGTPESDFRNSGTLQG